MHVEKLGFPLLFWLVLVQPVVAMTVDFEDLIGGTRYTKGDVFTSGGTQFDVIAYNGLGFTMGVIQQVTPPVNNLLLMSNSIGVEVAVPAQTNFLAFDYLDSCLGCSATGITVNGVASSPKVELANLGGTRLGGALVSIGSPSDARFQRRLTLTGPITSFAAGGTEFYFDNLVMQVPEPSTGALLCVASALALAGRRWTTCR